MGRGRDPARCAPVENQIEGHLLQPLVVGRIIKLHPLAIILVLAVGGVIAGIPGAIIAVPTAAVITYAWPIRSTSRMIVGSPSFAAKRRRVDLRREEARPKARRRPAAGERQAARGGGRRIDRLLRFGPQRGADERRLVFDQLAQRAASGKFDRFSQTKEWYGVYADVLDRLGWVGEGFAFSQRDTSAGEFRMDRAALDVIATVAAGGQLAILVRTLDALKTLGEGDRPLRIFDLQALGELSGNFQIGAAQKADNGATSMALGAFHFRAADNRGKFLFFGWGAKAVEFWTAVAKLTLNPDLYAVHRAAVVAKLKADAADYIDALEIK